MEGVGDLFEGGKVEVGKYSVSGCYGPSMGVFALWGAKTMANFRQGDAKTDSLINAAFKDAVPALPRGMATRWLSPREKPLAMFSPAPLRNLTKGPQRRRSDDAMDSLLIRSYVRLALT